MSILQLAVPAFSSPADEDNKKPDTINAGLPLLRLWTNERDALLYEVTIKNETRYGNTGTFF